MATAMKFRGLTGAVVDGSIRDTPQSAASSFRSSAAASCHRPPSSLPLAGVNVP